MKDLVDVLGGAAEGLLGGFQVRLFLQPGRERRGMRGVVGDGRVGSVRGMGRCEDE